MEDERKTKEELMGELRDLRKRNEKLEADIKKLRQAEEKLRESEKNSRRFLKAQQKELSLQILNRENFCMLIQRYVKC